MPPPAIPLYVQYLHILLTTVRIGVKCNASLVLLDCDCVRQRAHMYNCGVFGQRFWWDTGREKGTNERAAWPIILSHHEIMHAERVLHSSAGE